MVYYSLDRQVDGGVSDLSGNGNHITSISNVSWDAGILGTATRATVITGVLKNAGPLASNPDGGAFALSLWFIAKSTGGSYQCLVCETTSEGLYTFDGAGAVRKVSWFSGGADHVSDGGWSLNTWTHVVLNYSGTQAQIYLNGTPVMVPASAPISAGFKPTEFSIVNAQYYLDGYLDEAGAWSRTLTAAEIATLYNGGAGRTYPF